MTKHFQLEIVNNWPLRGYLHGLPQPCLRLLLRSVLESKSEPFRLDLAQFPELIQKRYRPKIKLCGFLEQSENRREIARAYIPVLKELVSLILRLEESAGWPLHQEAVIEHVSETTEDDIKAHTVLLILPSFNPQVLSKTLPWVFSNFSNQSLLSTSKDDLSQQTLAEVLAYLKRVSLSGTNPRYFMMASYHLHVPVQALVGQIMQYGWGSKSRWMNSSFTDRSSGISAQIARNKIFTHSLLKQAGLPVPLQALVPTLDVALSAATQIGYPVVVKPSDLDGGRGVEAGLQNEASLRQAYVRAARHSKKLILERHIEGKDYRLGVIYGQLAWATYREPAGVYGDGVSSIETLIKRANLNPRRGSESWSFMSPIVVDAEALELLNEQSVELSSVAEHGRFIKLKRAANISSGGYPIDVTECVHPDNIDLALRAARIVRLDIAGVDFITPDITRSWREVGGAICEVNGQPQISFTRPQAFSTAIRGLVEGDGRVPVIVFLFNLSWGYWSEYLQNQLSLEGIRPGFVLEDGVFIAKKRFGEVNHSAFDVMQNVLLDDQIDAVIVATDGRDWVRNGLPIDRVDLFVVEDATDQVVMRTCKPASKNPMWKLDASLRNSKLVNQALMDRLVQFLKNAAAQHAQSLGDDALFDL